MDQSITIRSGDLSCGETTRLFASRLLYGPVCIPLQLGMLFMCVVMLVWDVIRQHFWRDATLDDIYVHKGERGGTRHTRREQADDI